MRKSDRYYYFFFFYLKNTSRCDGAAYLVYNIINNTGRCYRTCIIHGYPHCRSRDRRRAYICICISAERSSPLHTPGHPVGRDAGWCGWWLVAGGVRTRNYVFRISKTDVPVSGRPYPYNTRHCVPNCAVYIIIIYYNIECPCAGGIRTFIVIIINILLSGE